MSVMALSKANIGLVVSIPLGEHRAKVILCLGWTKGRKRVLGIMAARKLAQHDPMRNVPATVSAIADAVQWAERILREIDQRWPVRN
jgi:hypothetical protein